MEMNHTLSLSKWGMKLANKSKGLQGTPMNLDLKAFQIFG
jgi:hypothetical protein